MNKESDSNAASQKQETNKKKQEISEKYDQEPKTVTTVPDDIHHEDKSSKLRYEDAETVIENETKLYLAEKVKEEIKIENLNCNISMLEQQISTLKQSVIKISTKNKDSNREIEIDRSRITHSESILLRNDSMITSLKEYADELESRLKRIKNNDLLNKCKVQHENLISIKANYELQLTEKKANFEKWKRMAITEKDHSNTELENLKEVRDELRKRNEEMRTVNTLLRENIAGELKRKAELEQKLNSVEDTNKAYLERYKEKNSDLIKYVEDIKKEKQELIEKLECCEKTKMLVRQQLQECIEENIKIATGVESINDKLGQKQTYLKELEGKVKEVENSAAEIRRKFENRYNETCPGPEQDIKINFAVEENTRMKKELEVLKAEYLEKCEEKIQWTNKAFELQKDLHKIRTELIENNSKKVGKREQLEKLEQHHNELIETLHVLGKEILDEENATAECRKLREKNEDDKIASEKYISEMMKKKEHLSASLKYLDEKLKNVRGNAAEISDSYQNLEKENESFKESIKQKKKESEELKVKLEISKKQQFKKPNKSILKSPVKSLAKKVNFNENLSFKSPTESESSSQIQNSSPSQKDTSFVEWLRQLKNKSAPNLSKSEKSDD